MEEKYVTIIDTKFYYGLQPFSIGSIIKLVKDIDNINDGEAIKIELPVIGKMGYVANSTSSVVRGTYSAGRIYDTFEDKCYAVVCFTYNDIVIAKIIEFNAINQLLMKKWEEKLLEEEEDSGDFKLDDLF